MNYLELVERTNIFFTQPFKMFSHFAMLLNLLFISVKIGMLEKATLSTNVSTYKDNYKSLS